MFHVQNLLSPYPSSFNLRGLPTLGERPSGGTRAPRPLCATSLAGPVHCPQLLSSARIRPRTAAATMEALTFNMSHGYTEGLVRGYRASLLTSQQYASLTQCETLDDLKMQLSATDYGNFLANEQPPISTSTIAEKATGKMVAEFDYLRANAVGDLAKFLDYLT